MLLVICDHKVWVFVLGLYYEVDSYTKVGAFDVSQLHGVIQIGLRPTSVAVITKSWLLKGHNIGCNSACVKDKCEMLVQDSGTYLLQKPSSDANRPLLPRQPNFGILPLNNSGGRPSRWALPRFLVKQKFMQNLYCEICSFTAKCIKMHLSVGLRPDLRGRGAYSASHAP